MGSNIDPEDNLWAAAARLRAVFLAARFSHVYESAPLLFIAQPPFLNAVMVADTELSPLQVYDVLKEIEQELKKDPPVRHGPRTIDLDLLLVDDQMIDEPDLIVPHPRMHERRFVLEPLLELVEPLERHPTLGRSWEALLQETGDQECKALDIGL